MLTFLTCCSSISEGILTTPLKLQKTVTTICINDVIPSRSQMDGGFVNDSSFISSSNNDDNFFAKIAGSHIEIDLTRKGYLIMHSPCGQYDVNLYIVSFYQPNNWPFDNRTLEIKAQISIDKDVPLFYVDHISVNPFGPLGDYLGYSTDDMLSEVSKQTTDHLIKILFNGPPSSQGR